VVADCHVFTFLKPTWADRMSQLFGASWEAGIMDLINFIRDIKENGELLSYTEDQVKQSVILPILQHLGWSIFNVSEVAPEYALGSKRVDYALRLNGFDKVFIEAKRPSVSLDKYQEQLLNYSFHAGVPLAILTSGISWWFYLPLQKGRWEHRKFFSVNIFEQNLDECALRFNEFIGKESVTNDSHIKSAEQVYEGSARARSIKNTLPKAWSILVGEPDEKLVELFKDKIEELCGHTPTPSELALFFDTVTNPSTGSSEGESKVVVPTLGTPGVRPPMGGNCKQPKDNQVGQAVLKVVIVEVLKGLGGKATKRQVVNIIHDRYREEFTHPYYSAPVAHGVERWKHNIAWAKEQAKHEALVKSPDESGRGIWELTERGRNFDTVNNSV